MESSEAQRELFKDSTLSYGTTAQIKALSLTRELLKGWQKKIHRHQSDLFKKEKKVIPSQGSLFNNLEGAEINNFFPLKLTPLPLSFWRWPSCPHSGVAIYLVMDRPKDLDTPLLLYIGETATAARRWKGEHDCKSYLAAYSEALIETGLNCQLSIRFWTDVPNDTKCRRQLEQKLIQQWLPPFNKETRARWSTPFTAAIN